MFYLYLKGHMYILRDHDVYFWPRAILYVLETMYLSLNYIYIVSPKGEFIHSLTLGVYVIIVLSLVSG